MPGAGIDRGRVVVRAFVPADTPAVRAIAAPAIGRLPCPEGARSAVDALFTGRDPDSRGLVGVDGEHVVGFVVFGSIAGTVDTGRIQLVVVAPSERRRGIGTRLVEGAVGFLDRDRSRVIFVELPDDPSLAAAMHLLVRCGFHVDARVADHVRDGVDLAILRRDPNPSTSLRQRA